MGLLKFEDLEVFKRAYVVSLEIHRASLEFPKIEQYGLADQTSSRRANRSARILPRALPSLAQSKAEFRRFLSMAVGSADEMRVWLRYCLDLGYIDEASWQRWRDEYEQIARMLQGLGRSLK